MHKAYIFDFGNVFINLDLKSIEIFLKENQIQLQDILPILYKFEKGLISTDKFINDFISLNNKLTREQIIKAWNNIVLDFPEYRLEFIEEFCQNHRCFLLSNINELHVKYIQNLLSENFYRRFVNSFEKVYYSHEIHLRKPDTEIFEYVLDNHQLKPQECYFIDDTEENILTARKIGFDTWHLIPEKDDIIELKNKLKL